MPDIFFHKLFDLNISYTLKVQFLSFSVVFSKHVGYTKESTPPTKAGKNNDCRQTNARTVYFIKYGILIFLTDPSKKGIKKDLF